VHPSKGQAFQSKNGKVGVGCTTYDGDSGAATGEVAGGFVLGVLGVSADIVA
jgi:hypothetical protein